MLGGSAALAPLAIALPIVAACVVLVTGRWLPCPAVDLLATAAALAVAGLTATLTYLSGQGRVVTWSGGWYPRRGESVGIALVAEPLSAGLACLAGGVTCCALLYSWRYLQPAGPQYHALMLLFLAGMVGFTLSGDLFTMFVFFELMGAVSYALTGLRIEEPDSVQGSLNFAVISSLGAYLSLIGVGLLYARTGRLGIAGVGAELAGPPDGLVVAAFVLVTTGFLVRAAMVPLHFWLPDTQTVAPAPVCALISGVMVQMGVYALARVYLTVFSASIPPAEVQRAFIVMGLLTAVVGSLMCLAQRHLKRLLAYSTTAHSGLFLIGFATLRPDGLAGIALYVAGHAGVTAALFLLAGLLLSRFGSADEADLFGRAGYRNVACWLFLGAALALAGLPPGGPALGRTITQAAAAAAGHPWLVAVFVLVPAATGGAVLRAGLRVFAGLGHRIEPVAPPDGTAGSGDEPQSQHRMVRTPVSMLAAIAVLVALSVAVGAVPALVEAAGRGAGMFSDRDGYLAQVRYAAPGQTFATLPTVAWTRSGVLLGVVSTMLAAAIAGLSLYARAPRPGRPPAHLARGLDLLRGLHSGHVGDYVAWLFLGAAMLAALIGLPLLL